MAPSDTAAGANRVGDAELLLGSLVALVALIAGRAWPLWGERLALYCPLLEIGGVPCPTCGGTRAFLALAAGDPLAALQWNPLVALLGVGLLAWPLLAGLVMTGWVRRPRVPTRLGTATRLAVPLLLAANWVYLLVWFRG